MQNIVYFALAVASACVSSIVFSLLVGGCSPAPAPPCDTEAALACLFANDGDCLRFDFNENGAVDLEDVSTCRG